MTAYILSHHDIIALVRDGSIRLVYYSVRRKDGSILKLLYPRSLKIDLDGDTDDVDVLIRDYFLDSLEPDSLTLHIGPYARLGKYSPWKPSPYTFSRGGDTILDIHRAQLVYIPPWAHLIVGTNEYIEVSSHIGASLHSNVRNTDIGISHVSTIIDPSWKGILQISIVNETRFTKVLKYHDPICIARFHKHNTDPPNDSIERFRRRRPHFGIDWWMLEKEDGRPFFPMRHEYLSRGEFANIARKEGLFQSFKSIVKFVGVPFLITGVLGASFFIAKLSRDIDNAVTMSQNVEQSLRRIEIGEDTFFFTETKPERQLTVSFERQSSADPFISYEIIGANASQVEVDIERNTVNELGTRIYKSFTITARAKDPVVTSVKIKWIVIHQTFRPSK